VKVPPRRSDDDDGGHDRKDDRVSSPSDQSFTGVDRESLSAPGATARYASLPTPASSNASPSDFTEITIVCRRHNIDSNVVTAASRNRPTIVRTVPSSRSRLEEQLNPVNPDSLATRLDIPKIVGTS